LPGLLLIKILISLSIEIDKEMFLECETELCSPLANEKRKEALGKRKQQKENNLWGMQVAEQTQALIKQRGISGP
jgi:hypothetical protein